jgi:hypothetical protein
MQGWARPSSLNREKLWQLMQPLLYRATRLEKEKKCIYRMSSLDLITLANFWSTVQTKGPKVGQFSIIYNFHDYFPLSSGLNVLQHRNRKYSDKAL